MEVLLSKNVFYLLNVGQFATSLDGFGGKKDWPSFTVSSLDRYLHGSQSIYNFFLYISVYVLKYFKRMFGFQSESESEWIGMRIEMAISFEVFIS